MNKLKELQRLHKLTEINFKITTFWDDKHNFYFDTTLELENGDLIGKEVGEFETLEEGIDWLIKCYERYLKENKG